MPITTYFDVAWSRNQFEAYSRKYISGTSAKYCPCAFIRPCRTGSQIDSNKVLMFFNAIVAEDFNKWCPGRLRQSSASGRWYMLLDITEGVTGSRGKDTQLRSFLRKAAVKAEEMDADFPLKSIQFKPEKDEFTIIPKLSFAAECDGAFSSVAFFEHIVKNRESSDIPNEPVSLDIKNVIINGPATIVFWTDGTKTVVQCNDFDTIDHEKGIFAACAKKLLGTNKTGSNYLDKIYPAMKKAEEDKAKRIMKEESR